MHLKHKKIAVFLVVLLLVAAVTAFFWTRPAPKPPASHSTGGKPAPVTVPVRNQFNKSQYPIDVASSLWAVVNKGRALPGDYVPAGLTVPDVPLRYGSGQENMHVRPETADALKQMFAAAKQDDIDLELTSGYRSYSYQVSVYNSYASSQGVQQADTFSARPGHSEHQTGLAADLEPTNHQCELDQCFGNLPEGKWLAANCFKYGFIIRYPKDAQNLTGYEYEPWHVRYVGLPLASQLQSSGQTLEQFFGLNIFTSYPSQSLTLKID